MYHTDRNVCTDYMYIGNCPALLTEENSLQLFSLALLFLRCEVYFLNVSILDDDLHRKHGLLARRHLKFVVLEHLILQCCFFMMRFDARYVEKRIYHFVVCCLCPIMHRKYFCIISMHLLIRIALKLLPSFDRLDSIVFQL